ncbi:hypothetical protein [Mongoliibacter ruber]|uniref:Antitoxin component YwqK of YwqJK toxin-antitoxin module n=1 Tax=Mongoliibacter ruber TaxID=1750599 RepID=A0A2T0WG99_9BACT|nr:hypothetical protein [Mongoliibacter ruber]PRY85695.1 hypothetical protein CLW00_11137 [Mongoliibacter ruber]
MKNYLLLLMLFWYANSAIGQEKYSGDYTFNGLRGEGEFEFVKGEGDAILKQGEFKFIRKERDIEDKTIFYRTEIFGSYEKDQKTGTWNYREEKHNVLLEDVKDFKLEYDINSQQIILKASYLNGAPEGKWIFEENEYREGELRKKSVVDDLIFEEGDLKGRFQYRTFIDDRSNFIRGELLPGGVMNGEWTFVYQQGDVLVSEVRNYENGFLLGLVKRNLETGENLGDLVFFQTIAKLNRLNSGEKVPFRIADEKSGIFFNDGILASSEQYQKQVEANIFISEFLTNVLRYDESFVNQDGDLIEYPVHTRRFVFDLSRTQQKAIEDLPIEFDRIKRIVRDYSNRNSLRINRQRSDSLAYANAYFDFRAKRLEEFEELIELFKSKEIQYYDVEYMVETGLPFIEEVDRIEYIYDGDTIVRELEFDLSAFELGFYEGMTDYFTQLASSLLSTKSYVDNSLSQIERDSDLRSIENQIQDRKLLLDEIYINTEGIDDRDAVVLLSVHQNILIEEFESKLEEYSKLNRFAEKKENARIILDLLEDMEEQHSRLQTLHEIVDNLDKLYQEEVFNPFTYSRYDQRAKSRLYEAAEVLIEHYFESIKSERDYTQIKIWIDKLELLDVRMRELREADTRRLENRINRRMDVSRIESMLDI